MGLCLVFGVFFMHTVSLKHISSQSVQLIGLVETRQAVFCAALSYRSLMIKQENCVDYTKWFYCCG